MADDRPRRRTPLIRLGAPGPYVLFAACATAGWFPVRWWETGQPVRALLSAGVGGLVWGLFPYLLGLVDRNRAGARAERDEGWERTRQALRHAAVPADEWTRAAVVDHLPAARRGALIGIVGGVLLFGGLAVLALAVGRPTSSVLLGLALVAVLAVAARTLTRTRRLARDLAAPAARGPARPTSRPA